MSLTLEQKAELYDANAKLCRAVQQHPCLYDRSNAHYVKKGAYDAAWADIAKQCDESVTSCKVRWRNIRTAFIRSVNNKPKKRMPNRTREYYLHDVLEFFLPHITSLQDGEELHESECESEAGKKKTETNISKEDLKEKSSQEREEGESTTSAEEIAADEPGPEEQLEKQPKKKSKVNTFYITEKQTKSGTFYIKKVTPTKTNTPTNEMSTTNADVVAEINKSETAKDSDTGSEKSKKTTPRSRYRRNCKRGLDKTMISQLRVRKREPEMKRQRRSMERIKSLTKAAALVVDSNKAQLKTQGRTVPGNKARKETKLSIENAIVTPNDVVETQMGYCQIPTAVAQPDLHKPRQLVELASAVPQSSPEMKSAASSLMDKAVQCCAQSKSMDEEFLHSLKPYMSDMNARQKLHFKKKVYETLMEVFDNPANFPGMPAPAVAITPPPTAVELLTNEELRLVRELAAVVQAAKRTPELMNVSASENKQDLEINSSETERDSMPSATATVDTINNPIVVPESVQLPPNESMQPPSPSNGLESTAANASNTPCRIIRKVMRVGDSGSATLTTQKGENRRIFRIFPRRTVNAASESGAAVSSVGTFIIPRTSLSATTGGAASTSTTMPSGTTTYRKIAIPASAVNWAEASILRATSSPSGVMSRRGMSVRGRAQGSPRQLLRRYSICGAYPGLVVGADNRMPTKIITAPSKAQTSLTWSAGSANGNGNDSVDVARFKVPNAVNNSGGACKATRAVAADASVNADGSGGAKNLSLSTFLGTHSSLAPIATPTTLNAEKSANARASPERAGVKRSLRAKSISIEKRGKVETVEETAGTIASDDFAGLSIKPEPLDDCF